MISETTLIISIVTAVFASTGFWAFITFLIQSSTGWRVFLRGGSWDLGSGCGLFTALLNGTSSVSGTGFGSRLLYIPS